MLLTDLATLPGRAAGASHSHTKGFDIIPDITIDHALTHRIDIGAAL